MCKDENAISHCKYECSLDLWANGERKDKMDDFTQNESKQEDIKNSPFDSTRLDKQELDSIDAQKLLQIIQSEELKVQERLRKFNSNRKKPDKDW